MKTITRYVFQEILKMFVIALVVLTLVLIIGVLVKEAVSVGIPLKHVLRLVPYAIIKMSPVSVPMALLMAVTTFFSKMSGSNEVIALKSLGIAPWRFLWPVMVFSVFVSLGAVWVNEMAVTWGRAGMEGIIYSASEDILLEQLRTEHRFQTDSMEIVVQGVENRRLIAPVITEKKNGARIEAQEAELRIDFLTQELTITLHNIKGGKSGDVLYAGAKQTFVVELDKILNVSDSQPKSPSEKSLWDIPKEIAEHNEIADTQRRKIAAARAFAATMGAVDAWSSPQIREMKAEIKREKKLNNRLAVEPPRRWSAGFTCLLFVWLGAPMAIWIPNITKASDTFTSFFACFIPILLFYYPLFMFGLQGAKNGSLPTISVWTANLCLFFVGAWFLQRIHRY